MMIPSNNCSYVLVKSEKHYGKLLYFFLNKPKKMFRILLTTFCYFINLLVKSVMKNLTIKILKTVSSLTVQ